MKTFLFTLATLMLMSAGKCGKTHKVQHLVAIESGSCFGFCPVFKLIVQNDGWVHFEGIRFTEKIGKDSFQLTADELKRLKTKVKDVNLWQYPDHVETHIADAPYVTLTAFDGKNVKQVKGSVDRPAPLLELENLLKDLAEAHGIAVKRGVNPNEIPDASKRELIVRLKPELNAGNWIAQFSDIRIRLVRRLSEDNIWLLTYDGTQVEEKTLIEILKKTDGVVDVQSNKKVQERN
ncbi:MAG: hypothetical protein IPJ82_15590 [Lewinellaceae bacterium]|nr:hypothetical protein [Lewinellaceae bacterium]